MADPTVWWTWIRAILKGAYNYRSEIEALMKTDVETNLDIQTVQSS